MIKTYKDIQGWFNFEDFYADVVNKVPNEGEVWFLEVGNWLGRSTGFLGSKIKESGKNIKLVCVDTFFGEDACDFQTNITKERGCIYFDFLKNMRELGLSDIIVPVPCNSFWAPDLFPKNHKFDFIFIDAAHDYVSVHEDIIVYWDFLKPNGVMAGHDYEKDVEKAVHGLFDPLKIPVTRVNTCWVVNKTEQKLV